MPEITVARIPAVKFPEIFAMCSICAATEATCFDRRNVQLNDDSGGNALIIFI